MTQRSPTDHPKTTGSHKDQMNFYGRRDDECSDFAKQCRFKKKTVQTLAMLLEEEIGLIGLQNNTFDTEKHLNIALRFYASGSFEGALGDVEGASQPSCSCFLTLVSKALSDQCDVMVRFCIDKTIMQNVSQGFYVSACKLATADVFIG